MSYAYHFAEPLFTGKITEWAQRNIPRTPLQLPSNIKYLQGVNSRGLILTTPSPCYSSVSPTAGEKTNQTKHDSSGHPDVDERYQHPSERHLILLYECIREKYRRCHTSRQHIVQYTCYDGGSRRTHHGDGRSVGRCHLPATGRPCSSCSSTGATPSPPETPGCNSASTGPSQRAPVFGGVTWSHGIKQVLERKPRSHKTKIKYNTSYHT